MVSGVDDARSSTIVAIATAAGRSGLGVVRMSGPNAKPIAEAICRRRLKPRFAHFSKYFDQSNIFIDEGITIYFSNPKSFTGEDVVEFQSHGSPLVLEKLQEACLHYGAKIARPGEFTERAFLNGKIDLLQAEAIADLIDSQSEQCLKSANESLQGVFSKSIHTMLAKLIGLRVNVEGALDFPEEEIDFIKDNSVLIKLKSIVNDVEMTLDSSRTSALLRQGIKVVLMGEPNVGKSTLMNVLTGTDTAIVTDIPGTTRDRLEQSIIVNGIPVTMIDTAGIRQTDDVIEKEGVDRAKKAISEADVVIHMIEPNNKNLPDLSYIKAPIIHVVNKIDIVNTKPGVPFCIDQQPVFISATKQQGIDGLFEKLSEVIKSKSFKESPRLARTRHVNALQRCLQALLRGEEQLLNNKAPELLAEELQQAQNCLSEITGEFLPDDLLGEIFSRFCIGK